MIKKIKADSIKDAWVAKGNFTELLRFSDDKDNDGVVNTEGIYDWFSYGAMVPQFEDYSMTAEIGKVDVVQTKFGYHVMEVLSRRTTGNMRIKAPTIERRIVPMDTTIANYQDSAYRFIRDAREVEDFEAYCKSHGFFGVIQEEDIIVSQAALKSPDLENNNIILKWAFNSELNEVSDYFYMHKSFKLIIAKLSQNIPEGSPSLETAKQIMYEALVKKKKGDYLKAQANGVDNLAALVQKWGVFGGPQNATGISFQDKNLKSVTQKADNEEPAVIGTIFTLEPGKLSGAVAGTDGMYVLKVDEFIPITQQKDNFDIDRARMEGTLRARADGGIMKGLRDFADIKDYRKKNELINQ
ncbi:MAG: peptidylprolyl isomerase [Flavobacteriales bacterium]|nr:peptidylprolyl isomerase [Flavobacteriales bacterium]